jgi:hypothetical protein
LDAAPAAEPIAWRRAIIARFNDRLKKLKPE